MIIEKAAKSPVFKSLILGCIIGLVLAIFAGAAYINSGDARFCGSCHSMKLVQSRWQASHHKQFSCTECHLPDINLVGKVAYKTKAGLNDLVHETSRNYSAGIGLSTEGKGIINTNCVRCHASTIAATPMTAKGSDCLKCHRYLVHGRGVDEGGIKVE
jgi:cytochrome c nitrite reductase small subunit